MAALGQGDTTVLLGRARRVRQRLHQGVPEGWTAGAKDSRWSHPDEIAPIIEA